VKRDPGFAALEDAIWDLVDARQERGDSVGRPA
jgi:hypothetical protein